MASILIYYPPSLLHSGAKVLSKVQKYHVSPVITSSHSFIEKTDAVDSYRCVLSLGHIIPSSQFSRPGPWTTARSSTYILKPISEIGTFSGCSSAPVISPLSPLSPKKKDFPARSRKGCQLHRGSCHSSGQGLKRRPVTARAAAHAEEEGGRMALFGIQLTAKQLQVASAAALTTVLALCNRILYKMALVPLREYPFFLAQLTTFGYVGVYFSVLAVRYRAGIVTREMLALPKGRFALMGALEALGLASGMAAAAKLPGALISILSQVYLVWQLVLSHLILGKRYTPLQIAGCLLVVLGVAIVVASGSGAGSALASAGLWPLLLIVSTAFPAAATILKELVFSDAAERLPDGGVDLFVVNSFGSGFQALFVFLLLPMLSSLRGIPFSQLPAYFRGGAACLLNFGATGTGCEGAPLVPLLYVAANLAFNISALNLLKTSSAIVASLTLTLVVPLTIVAFTFPLPLLGEPAPLPPGFGLGVAVLVAGLGMYNVLGAKKKSE